MFRIGFEKIASMKLPGPRGGAKPMAQPTRITPTTRPGNPVTNLKGLTGAPAMQTFGRPINNFGTTARKGLTAMSRVRGGL